MNGKEFLESVRAIEVISEVKWELTGEVLDPDEVYFVYVADGEERSILFPAYDEEDTQSMIQLAAIGLIINKFMKQIGNPFRYNVHMDEVEAINFSRLQVK